MGRIIVIESSTDGCGKQTQTEMLYKRMKESGEKVKKFTFPNYESDSSIFVKKYLAGEFGKNAEQLNPYIVSTFFALDRYITYITEIKKYYEQGYTIIFDRYVTSNFVYQAGKIEEFEKAEKFIEWNKEYEYSIYGLPKPDNVIYLHMKVKEGQDLIKCRKNKFTDKEEKDIHETNMEYLEKAYNMAEYISKKEGWIRIECVNQGEYRTIEEISDEIIKKLKQGIA